MFTVHSEIFLFQPKSLTRRMMTMILCVSSIKYHNHHQDSQTCDFYPTHIQFTTFSGLFRRRKVLNVHAYWKPLWRWIDWDKGKLFPPLLSHYNNNNNHHRFASQFIGEWNEKMKRKEGESRCFNVRFTFHTDVKRCEESTSDTKKTTNERNIIGKWANEDLNDGKPEARLNILIFSVILFILDVLSGKRKEENCSVSNNFPIERLEHVAFTGRLFFVRFLPLRFLDFFLSNSSHSVMLKWQTTLRHGKRWLN